MHQSHIKRDRLLHATLMDGQARVLICDTTGMVQEARQTHSASAVATAAMGRMIAAAAMLSAQLKNAEERITATIRGGGPGGTLTAVAGRGQVKVTLDHPEVELPLRPDGKLDVGGALGREGRLSVIRDLGFGEPYIGQVALVSGEVAEDFAMYFHTSEQTPALCALGVLQDEAGVTGAGGVLIQALPGCSDKLLDALEVRAALFSGISATLAEQPLEDIITAYFRGLEPVILEEVPLVLHCDCSRERIERALISLGEAELKDILAQQGQAELRCHFCQASYTFDAAQLSQLIAEAKGVRH